MSGAKHTAIKSALSVILMLAAGAPATSSDTCDADTVCRYALAGAGRSMTADPWRRFHNSLGARFDTKPASRAKAHRKAASTRSEVTPASSRTGRIARDPNAAKFMLLYILLSNGPSGR